MPLVPLREEVPITQGRLRPLTPVEETGPPARVKARGVRGEVEVGTGPDLPIEELKWSAGGGFLPGSAEELLSVLLDPANLLTLGTAGTTAGLRQGLTMGPALKRGASWMAQGVPDIIKGVRGGAQGLLKGLSASEIEKRIPPAMATPIKAPPFSQITSPSQIALERATQMNLPFSTSVGTPMERTYPEYLRLKELIDKYKAQQDTAAQKFITRPPLDPTGRTKAPLTLPTGDIPTLVERSEKLLRQGPEWIEREMKRVPSVSTPPPVQAPLRQPYLPLGVRPEAPPTPRTPEGLLAGPPTPTRLSPMTGEVVGGGPPLFREGKEPPYHPYYEMIGGKEAVGKTKGVLREMGARTALDVERLKTDLKDATAYFIRQPLEKKYAFQQALDTGNLALIPPNELPYAARLEGVFKEWRGKLQKLGPEREIQWLENYFPHIWKDPDAVKAYLHKKAALSGSKRFMHERSVLSIQEGLENGLLPRYPNPVDATLAKIHEMSKFVGAHEAAKELFHAKVLRIFREGKEPPEWVPLNDAVFRLVAKKGEKAARYYAPPQVAGVFNNLLSPGLNQYATFRGYRQSANLLNQAQLGLSAFHAGFTTADVMVSRLALGLNKIANGDVMSGLKSITTTPIAPFTNPFTGNKLLKAALNPKINPELQPIVEALMAGGGRLKMDPFYQTALRRKLLDSYYESGTIQKIAGLLGPSAREKTGVGVEKVTKGVEKLFDTILEDLVPRQKLGVFSEMMKYELKRNPNMTHDELRTIAGKVSDSIDNRLGQLIYANKFWPKIAKDLGMASTRALGWNVGTILEVGGGSVDIIKGLAQVAMGKKPELSYRAAYTIALPIIAGSLGILTDTLMTGDFQSGDWRNYYFPRSGYKDGYGKDIRVSLPTYVKDVYSYGHDVPDSLIATVSHKLHPLVTGGVELATNKDFFNTEITHPADSLGQKAWDYLSWAGKFITPYGIKGYQEMAKKEEPLSRKVLPFIGVFPASTSVGRSSAELLASKLVRRKYGVRSKEEAERYQEFSTLMARKGRGVDVSEEAVSLMRDKRITPNQYKRLLSERKEDFLLNMVKAMSAQRGSGKDIRAVWEKGTEEERRKIAPFLIKSERREGR